MGIAEDKYYFAHKQRCHIELQDSVQHIPGYMNQHTFLQDTYLYKFYSMFIQKLNGELDILKHIPR